MKTTNVKITLRSELPGEEIVNQELLGTLTMRDEETVELSYKEPQTMGGVTRLTFSKDRATMERTGQYSAKMEFQVGKSLAARYETPYGIPKLTVTASTVGHTLKETGGKAMLRYSITSDGMPIGTYTLKFNVKENDTHE